MPHGSAPHFAGAVSRRRLCLAAGTTGLIRAREPHHGLALLQCLGTGETRATRSWASQKVSGGSKAAIGGSAMGPGWFQRCLGVAHSHPASEPLPSLHERRSGEAESLVLILSASLGLRAWWLHGDRSVDEIPIQLWDTRNHA